MSAGSSTAQLFQVANWPRLPEDLSAADHPEVGRFAEQAKEWMRQLCLILDHTMLAGGAAVGEAVEEHPYPPTRVLFAGTDGQISTDPDFTYTPANDRLSIGKVGADFRSAIVGAYMGAATYGSYLLATASNSAYPLFEIARARGSMASLAAVQGEDLLGWQAIWAHTGTAWKQAIQFRFYANQNWSDAAQGSRFELWGVVDGATALSRWVRVVNGQWQLPSGSAAAPALAFISDPDTGPSNPAANTYDINVGGVAAVRITISGGKTLVTKP